MSATNISDKNKNLLWAITAGRCEYRGCNTPLYQDILTKTQYNRSYIAHIVADSPDGPRGDITRSPQLKDSISNLMLLCDGHHRLIDHEGLLTHPEDVLVQMKKEHEHRINMVTSISQEMGSHIVTYRANIDAQTPPVTYATVREFLLPQYYPAIDQSIDLGLLNSPSRDKDENFWSTEVEALITNFNDHLRPKLRLSEIHHISLFAMAPQPLLIKLGTLLNDIQNITVHQRIREPFSWKLSDDIQDIEYIIKPPNKSSNSVALNISLSADILNERITKVMGSDCDIYTLTIDTPNNDFLKYKNQLSQFRITMRNIFNEIKKTYGEKTVLNIFPAMPVATAIELGRVWMPKADMRLAIYDQNTSLDGFQKALEIKQEVEHVK